MHNKSVQAVEMRCCDYSKNKMMQRFKITRIILKLHNNFLIEMKINSVRQKFMVF